VGLRDPAASDIDAPSSPGYRQTCSNLCSNMVRRQAVITNHTGMDDISTDDISTDDASRDDARPEGGT